MNFGTWTAIGIALGAAMGAGTDLMGAWVGLGAGIGIAMGAATNRSHDGDAH